MKSEDVVGSNPVDSTAARVTSKPSHLYQFESKKKILQTCSDVPLPVRAYQKTTSPNSQDLSGRVAGRLTVIGVYAEAIADKVRWVCRCACGNYTVRSSKAVKNESNTDDCCEKCREVKYLRRKDEYYRHGRNLDQ